MQGLNKTAIYLVAASVFVAAFPTLGWAINWNFGSLNQISDRLSFLQATSSVITLVGIIVVLAQIKDMVASPQLEVVWRDSERDFRAWTMGLEITVGETAEFGLTNNGNLTCSRYMVRIWLPEDWKFISRATNGTYSFADQVDSILIFRPVTGEWLIGMDDNKGCCVITIRSKDNDCSFPDDLLVLGAISGNRPLDELEFTWLIVGDKIGDAEGSITLEVMV